MLNRPHFICISGTPTHPFNYPEELGAIRELGRVHGFSPSASGLLLKAHIWALQIPVLIYGSRYFLSRLVFLKGDHLGRAYDYIFSQESTLNADEIHYSDYDFQHCVRRGSSPMLAPSRFWTQL